MKANRTLLNACAFIALTTAAQAADIPKTWVETQAGSPTGQYLVIDLTLREIAVGQQTDPDTPPVTRQGFVVSNLAAVPPGGWTDEYKTTKLVLRRIPAGTFTMGSPTNELGREADEAEHPVTLTKDFYIGVFEVTQKQWKQVMGDWVGSYHGTNPRRDIYPMHLISYYQIREKFETPAESADNRPVPSDDPAVDWPANSVVNEDSFMGKLRAKTGLTSLDLPTEAQWEYACRAGTTTALNSGKDVTAAVNCPNMAEVGRYYYNVTGPKGYDPEKWYYGQGNLFKGYTQYTYKFVGTIVVGSYPPNTWGLYDMHGNVWEWCLDWYAETYPGAVTDPKGPATGKSRVLRGGSSDDIAKCCRAANRGPGGEPNYRNGDFGFRVVMTMP